MNDKFTNLYTPDMSMIAHSLSPRVWELDMERGRNKFIKNKDKG